MEDQIQVYFIQAKISPVIREDDGLIHYDQIMATYGGVDHMHIYVTSNETIQEGDWTFGISDKLNYKGKRVCQAIENMVMLNYPDIAKISRRKIIASTDEKLNIKMLDEANIKHLISEYNKGNAVIRMTLEDFNIRAGK